jgi:hypothetical protein
MLQTVFAMLALVIVIALPVIALMGAVMYGSNALGWGLHRYPKAVMAIVLLLALAATLSYPRFFPRCTLRIGLGHLADCAAHSPKP